MLLKRWIADNIRRRGNCLGNAYWTLSLGSNRREKLSLSLARNMGQTAWSHYGM